jgi:ubiquinone/menaquinone biosynthesis C-methylase UbiE
MTSQRKGVKGEKGDGAGAPWHELAFGPEYLDLYLHRDLAEAARTARFLADKMQLSPSHRLLDLCCGPGRHLAFLKDRVGLAVGVDLSSALLARAREHAQLESLAPEGRAPAQARLARADMRRLPLADASFDRVVNLFTSFGYFEDEAENRRALAEVARVLKPGGLLAMDHINRDRLRAKLVPRGQRRLANGTTVLEERHWEDHGRRVVKRVELRARDGSIKRWRESVRVYAPEELEAMLREAGLEPLARHGDDDGSPWSPESPRLIVMACKRES